MLGVHRAAIGVIPAIGIAGEDADMAAAEAGGFELANSFRSGAVIVEHAGDDGGHVLFPLERVSSRCPDSPGSPSRTCHLSRPSRATPRSGPYADRQPWCSPWPRCGPWPGLR